MSSSRRSGARPQNRSRTQKSPRPPIAPPPQRSSAWYAPRVGWIAVRASCFLVIVLFMPGGTEPYGWPKLAALWAGVLIGMAGWISWRVASGDRVPFPRVGLAVLAYLAVTAVATAFSVSPLLSLLGRASRHSGLMTLVAIIALSWLVVAFTWRRPDRLEQLVVVFVLATAVHVLFVIPGWFGFEVTFANAAASPVPIGTIGNSNFAGAQIVIAVPLLLYLRTRAGSARARWAILAATGVFCVAVLLTQARGAALGIFPAVAVAGALAPALAPRWITRLAAALSVLLLVLVVLAATGAGNSLGGPGSKLTNLSTLTDRVQFWKGSVGIARDHPLIGTGPDTFGLVFPPYSPQEMTGRPFPVDKPHNILLERLNDAGLLGLASYVAVLGMSAVAIVRARRLIDARERAMLAAFAAAFVAYLVQGLTSIDAIPLAIDGWLMLAGVAVLADPWIVRARAAAAAEAGKGGSGDVADSSGLADWNLPDARVALPLVLPLALVVVAGLVVSIVPIVADRQFRAAFDVQQAVLKHQAPPGELMAAFDGAMARNPLEPRISQQAAESALRVVRDPKTSDADRRVLIDYAQRRANEALAQTPGDVPTGVAAAEASGFRALAGDQAAWAETEARYRELEQWDPYNTTILISHADILVDWAEATRGDAAQSAAHREAARANLDRAVMLKDDSWWYPWYSAARVYKRLGLRQSAIDAAKHAAELGPDNEPARLELQRFAAAL